MLRAGRHSGDEGRCDPARRHWRRVELMGVVLGGLVRQWRVAPRSEGMRCVVGCGR